LHYISELTQLNRQQEQNVIGLIEMAVSCGFQKKERVYGETNQLSYYCCIPSGILGETSNGNHGTRQHHPPHNAGEPHQQTFDLPSYMQQTETGNFWLWRVDLLVEAQDNEREATVYCCSSHYNIDEQSLHQGIPECTSAIIEEEERISNFRVFRYNVRECARKNSSSKGFWRQPFQPKL